QLAQVADAQVDLADAAGMQPSQDVFEDRAVADGDKRLRQDRRVRAQPRAEPSCQDHGPHRRATGYIRALADGCPRYSPSEMAEQLVAPSSQGVEGPAVGLRRIAIVPALNEERSIGAVIAEIRAADPEFDVIVIDDGSTDRTGAVAAENG